MVEQADVYVKNISADGLMGDIRAIRKLPDGSSDIDVTITPGNEEKILLWSTEVSLIISPPNGWTIDDCLCDVRKGSDIVSCSETDPNWTIQIKVPNDGNPEGPTTVNVDVGGQPPAP
jgi:hypothetical protein